jgi:anti-sigma factor RsiW
MKAVEHTVAAEELMAYLDGEVAEERRVAVHAHVLQCEPCGRLLSELRQASRDAALWQVGPVPENLRPPAVARDAGSAEAGRSGRCGRGPAFRTRVVVSPGNGIGAGFPFDCSDRSAVAASDCPDGEHDGPDD